MKVADKNESVVMRRIALHTQKVVAEAIGVEPSNFSRFKNSSGHGLQLKKYCELLAFLGIDLSQLIGEEATDATSDETVTIPRAQFEALRTLAKQALEVA